MARKVGRMETTREKHWEHELVLDAQCSLTLGKTNQIDMKFGRESYDSQFTKVEKENYKLWPFYVHCMEVEMIFPHTTAH